LVISYSNMKPLSTEPHKYLADWVKKGGVLLYCGEDNDHYQAVMEWWNTKGNHFSAASQHLFQSLGFKATEKEQRFKVGKGTVYVLRKNPKEFVLQPGESSAYIEIIKKAFEENAKAGKPGFKNSFYLQRGFYDIISVMDEGINNESFTINAPVIDLFDPELPILNTKVITPRHRAFLLNLNRVKEKNKPQVLASALRIYDENVKLNSYSFVCKSPINTTNSMRILLPNAAGQIIITNSNGEKITNVASSRDTASHTACLRFENNPDGIKVDMKR
jgi:hypothetical protein